MTAAVIDRVRGPRLIPAPLVGPPLTLIRRRAAAPPRPTLAPRRATSPLPPVDDPVTVHRRWAPVEPIHDLRARVSRTDTLGTVRAMTVGLDELSSWSRDVPPTATAQLPAAMDWARAICRGLFESFAGRRPLQQLQPHCSPDVFFGLAHHGERSDGAAAALISLAVCHPADGAAEVAATFRSAGKVRALAMRIQGLGGRWRITALQIG